MSQTCRLHLQPISRTSKVFSFSVWWRTHHATPVFLIHGSPSHAKYIYLRGFRLLGFSIVSGFIADELNLDLIQLLAPKVILLEHSLLTVFTVVAILI